MLEPSAPADAPRRRSVLVVEDEILVRMAAAEAIRDAGFVVIEASNADEALEFVRAGETPNAVFTDVRMPGSLNGLQLIAELKRALPNLVVVVTSAHLDVCSQMAHAFPFLPKPYDPDSAVNLIVEALQR